MSSDIEKEPLSRQQKKSKEEILEKENRLRPLKKIEEQ